VGITGVCQTRDGGEPSSALVGGLVSAGPDETGEVKQHDDDQHSDRKGKQEAPMSAMGRRIFTLFRPPSLQELVHEDSFLPS